MLGALVGAPAYLNGYAAVPLIDALLTQGMAPGAAMSFVIAGGVSCIPAAIAVWALVKPRVFAAYASAGDMTPSLSFYPFMFKNVTLRLLIVYQISPQDHRRGAAQLKAWLEAGALSHSVEVIGDLSCTAEAHDRVAGGSKLGTIAVSVP